MQARKEQPNQERHQLYPGIRLIASCDLLSAFKSHFNKSLLSGVSFRIPHGQQLTECPRPIQQNSLNVLIRFSSMF
jgi:hypothetical protein